MTAPDIGYDRGRSPSIVRRRKISAKSLPVSRPSGFYQRGSQLSAPITKNSVMCGSAPTILPFC